MVRKTLIAVAAAGLIAGCSINQQQLATQYATRKLLEGEHVTQEAVLSRVDRVRLQHWRPDQRRCS